MTDMWDIGQYSHANGREVCQTLTRDTTVRGTPEMQKLDGREMSLTLTRENPVAYTTVDREGHALTRETIELSVQASDEVNNALTFAHITHQWPTKICPKAKGHELEWPLHLKEVNRIDLTEAGNIVQATCAANLQLWLDSIDPFNDPPPTHCQMYEAELEPIDIDALLRAQVIRVDPCPDQNAWGLRVFSVPEATKLRRRCIMHPPEFNAARDHTPVKLPTPEEVIQAAGNYRYATCLDISAYYQHLHMNQRFVFRYRGTQFLCNTIPTGARHCPSLAQVLSESIANVVRVQFPDVHVTVYLDNFRLLCNHRRTLIEATSRLCEVLRQHRIRVNEDDLTPSTHYTFLGMYFTPDTVHVGEKTRLKLYVPPLHCTMREFYRVFGLLSYCSVILDLPRFEYYAVFKFLKRRVGRTWDSRADMWPALAPVLASWIEAILAHPGRRTSKRTSGNSVLFTDACDKGWGAMLFVGITVTICGGPFTPAQLEWDIVDKEALAVQLACSYLNVPVSETILYVDNTSVLGAWHKGRSSSYLLNRILQHIPRGFVNVTFVPSHLNLADHPSRTMWQHGNTWQYTTTDPELANDENNS